MGDGLLLHIGSAFQKFATYPFYSYTSSYVRYDYQNSEGFDTSVGTYVGFPASVIALGGFAAGTFLSTVPGFPSAQTTLLQLPRTLRIFPDATSGVFANDFYPRLLVDLGESIDAALPSTLHGINEQTGYSLNPDNPSDDPRWLLQAIPNPTDSDTSHVVAGKVFVICCVAEAYPFYHSLTDPGPTATYLADYARFVAKHPRFQKFGGLLFRYPTGDVAEDAVIDAHMTNAINGTGGYPGALSDYGWQYLVGTNAEPSSSFWPYVRDFFGLS